MHGIDKTKEIGLNYARSLKTGNAREVLRESNIRFREGDNTDSFHYNPFWKITQMNSMVVSGSLSYS